MPAIHLTTGADYIDIPYNPYKDRIYETPAPTGGPNWKVEKNTSFDHLFQTTAIPNYDDIVSFFSLNLERFSSVFIISWSGWNQIDPCFK